MTKNNTKVIEEYIRWMDDNDIEYDHNFRPIQDGIEPTDEDFKKIEREFYQSIKSDVPLKKAPLMVGSTRQGDEKLPVGAVYSTTEKPPKDATVYETERGAEYWIKPYGGREDVYDDWVNKFTKGDPDERGLYSIPTDEHNDDVPYGQFLNFAGSYQSDVSKAAEKLPKGATDVKIAKDPANDIQISYKDSTGNPQHILNPSAQQEHRKKHWAKLRNVQDVLDDAMDTINKKGVNDLSPEEMLMTVYNVTGYRKGQDKDRKTDKGKITGQGALNLKSSNVHISKDGNTAHVSFDAKSGVRQKFAEKDPRLVEVLKKAKEGKRGKDKLFDTTSSKIDQFIRDIHPDATIKHLRTKKAIESATEYLNNYKKKIDGGGRKLPASEFFERAGLYVGERLGHKKIVKGKAVTESVGCNLTRINKFIIIFCSLKDLTSSRPRIYIFSITTTGRPMNIDPEIPFFNRIFI